MSLEMKFMRRMKKYTWQDEDILSELKMNSDVKKIQNYRNKWITCSVGGHRQTTTPDYDVSTTWQTKPRMTPQKTSRRLLGLVQATVPKTLQAIR
jgi:hypothetical protein